MSESTIDSGGSQSKIDEVKRRLSGRPPTSVSIAARVSLSAHALNNEGTRNNTIVPRQVDVVAGDQILQVNAVSGDMLKHAFVDYLRRYAESMNDAALPLCSSCRRGDPNRLSGDPTFQKIVADIDPNDSESVIDEVIARCVIDDIAGLLVTIGKRNAPRHSTIQFGWEVGIPDQVRTGRYIHLKLVPGESEESDVAVAGSNLGQNLFTRPASSGQYAFVARADLDRIGRNDVSRRLAISNESVRRARMRAALQALFLTVAMPDGAQTNTQMPHLQGASGAVSFSTSSLPPVLFSPLAADFVEQMEACAQAFGRADRDLAVVPFANVSELGGILGALADTLATAELRAG